MEIERPDFLPVTVRLISRERESRSFRASFDGGLLVMQISFSVRRKHARAKAHFPRQIFSARLKARSRAPFEAQGELEARGFQPSEKGQSAREALASQTEVWPLHSS